MEDLERQIPESVKKQVLTFVDRLVKKGLDRNSILQDIYKIATDPNILSDFQGDPTAAWVYAAERVYIRYSAKKENLVVAKSLVPFGITPIRVTSSGVKRSSIYALAKFEGSNKPELVEVVCRGSFAGIVEKIELFKVYNDIVLTNRGYFYEVTTQTNFPQEDNPGMHVDPLELVSRIGVKKVKMSEFATNLSRTDEQGYVDSFDLRYFEAYVVSPPRRGERQDGSQYGVYEVSDGTLEEDFVSEDGSIIVPVTVTVWCAPRFCVYDVESKIGILGTIQTSRRDNTVFVSAIYIHPIIVTGIVE